MDGPPSCFLILFLLSCHPLCPFVFSLRVLFSSVGPPFASLQLSLALSLCVSLCPCFRCCRCCRLRHVLLCICNGLRSAAMAQVMQMSNAGGGEADKEMHNIAKEELAECTAALEKLRLDLTSLLLPRYANQAKPNQPTIVFVLSGLLVN